MSTTTSRAQTPAITVFAYLGGVPDGYHPSAALIDGGDGSYYGTTQAGGPANCGTVYKIAPDGTFATLYTFTGGSDGSLPLAALVSGGDGFFYGTTSAGGTNGTGTIFKITSAGAFTSLYSLAAASADHTNTDGTSPQAALVSGGDGYFYGTASAGGAGGYGTIFRITPTGAFNLVYALAKGDGFGCVAALIPGGDSYLYGVASEGGTSTGGTIFRVSPGGAFQLLYAFTNGADGGDPKSALVLSGGQFYGLSDKTFFSVTPTGTFTSLYTSPTGQVPGNFGQFGGLAGGPAGTFYGTATSGVLQFTPAGDVTLVYEFSNDETDGSGILTAPLLGTDGNLYGVAASGGNGNDAGYGGGTVYQVIPSSGTINVLHLFTAGGSFPSAALMQYTDGTFYGVTQQGGAKNAGTVFGLTQNGEFFSVYDFDPDADGARPVAALVQDGSGNVYGSLSADGPGGGGALFQLTSAPTTDALKPDSKKIRKDLAPGSGFNHVVDIYLFRSTGDEGIEDDLIAFFDFFVNSPQIRGVSQTGGAGYLYGAAASGSTNGDGAIFSYSLADGSAALLHAFGGNSDGILPEGLTVGADGNFYGITYGGGTATVGTIFKITSDGTYSVLYSFQGTGDGAFPQTDLTAGSDGNLYGVTQHAAYSASSGFTGAPGTIFSITPGGTFTTLHTFAASGSEGSQPMAALLQASDGTFYGTTQDGVLFSITTGGQFTVLYNSLANFGTGGVSLYGAVAPLIQAADGDLYGTTSTGGPNGAGLVFKVALAAPMSSSFFTDQVALANGVYYLAFPSGNYFGYYSYLTDPAYIYHFDLGYEYVFDAADGNSGVYLYDFASSDFFYTSPGFPFPYLYDFGLQSTLYYYPDTTNPGHYNTNGIRYFYDFATGTIITK